MIQKKNEIDKYKILVKFLLCELIAMFLLFLNDLLVKKYNNVKI